MLDATVKGSSANSYITEVDATAYLTAERLYVTVWTAATTSQREQALIWATLLIDASFDFDGDKTTSTQALRWPRIGMYDADGLSINYDILPSLLKKATSTYALNLLTTNRVAEPGLLGLGIEEAKVGPIQVRINVADVKEIVPDDIQILLAPFGSLKAAASQGAATVTLKRA